MEINKREVYNTKRNIAKKGKTEDSIDEEIKIDKNKLNKIFLEEMSIEEYREEDQSSEVLSPRDRNKEPENKPAKNKGVIEIKDKNGAVYKKDMSKSRFNRFKHGKYSKFKNIYCSSCYLADRCELYKPGNICAFLPQFQKFPAFNRLNESKNVMKEMHRLLKGRWIQLQRAEFFARKDGGVIDKEVESVRGKLFDELKTYNDIVNNRPDVTVGVQKDPLAELFKELKEDGDKNEEKESNGKQNEENKEKEERNEEIE